jgi:hypothetical protein
MAGERCRHPRQTKTTGYAECDRWTCDDCGECTGGASGFIQPELNDMVSTLAVQREQIRLLRGALQDTFSWIEAAGNGVFPGVETVTRSAVKAKLVLAATLTPGSFTGFVPTEEGAGPVWLVGYGECCLCYRTNVLLRDDGEAYLCVDERACREART